MAREDRQREPIHLDGPHAVTSSEYRAWWINRFVTGWRNSTGGAEIQARVVPGDTTEWVDILPLDAVTHGDEIMCVGHPIPGARVPIRRCEPSPVTSLCAVTVRNDFAEYANMEPAFREWARGEVDGVPISCHVEVSPSFGWDIGRERNKALANAPVTSHVLICDVDTRMSVQAISATIVRRSASTHPVGCVESRVIGVDDHRRYFVVERSFAERYRYDDEFQGIFFEDTELCMRIAADGYVQDLVPLRSEDFWAQGHAKAHRGPYERFYRSNHELIKRSFHELVRRARAGKVERGVSAPVGT